MVTVQGEGRSPSRPTRSSHRRVYMTTANYPLEQNEVTSLYQTVLLRTPSSAEVTFWASALDSGTVPSLSALTTDFVTSFEAQTIVDPIVRLYQAFFNHAPDAAGLAYWVGQAHNGMDTANIAYQMTQSVEFNADYGATGGVI